MQKKHEIVFLCPRYFINLFDPVRLPCCQEPISQTCSTAPFQASPLFCPHLKRHTREKTNKCNQMGLHQFYNPLPSPFCPRITSSDLFPSLSNHFIVFSLSRCYLDYLDDQMEEKRLNEKPVQNSFLF